MSFYDNRRQQESTQQNDIKEKIYKVEGTEETEE